jgi:tetratricopeptide (TPR) repeat protein
LLQTSVDRWPHGRARFNFATVLKQQGRVTTRWHSCAWLWPTILRRNTCSGRSSTIVGQFDEAISELRAFIARVAGHAASRYDIIASRNLIGLCLAQQRKLTEAVDEFQLALQLDPENAGLHGNLAFILLQTGISKGRGNTTRHPSEGRRGTRSS